MLNIFKRLFQKDESKEIRQETCEYCIHLYHNSDGSVACDSPFEKACLQTKERAFKELNTEPKIIRCEDCRYWENQDEYKLNQLLPCMVIETPSDFYCAGAKGNLNQL